MIEDKTLLIIGAGASVPYGYPTGVQLRDELCDPGNLYGLCSSGHVDENGLHLFCQHFKESQLFSIDAFLAKRGTHRISQGTGAIISYGTYEEYGKLAIAHLLLKREIHTNLFDPPKDNNGNADHWLQYLWHNISEDVSKGEFNKTQLKLISFNYDRVLEQYFQTAIQRTYGINPEDAIQLRQCLEIIHIYGDLQNLENRPFGKMPDNIKTVAECIRVIPEAREESDVKFEEAKKMISWADKICFIGFSFEKTNVRRLGFPLDQHTIRDKRFFGTHYAMTNAEFSSAQRLLGINMNGGYSEELKTLKYLRNTGFFL